MGNRLEENSKAVQKRITSHTFSDEAGEEYGASNFGGFSDYFRRKKIKLQNLDAEIRSSAAEEKPQIFKGVVAHVTGFTQPPLHVLHHELVQHGAGFLQYLDSKTMATHIIASSLPPKKMIEFSRYRIVKPAWVMDSIQAGKLLPWSDYRVIEENARQKTIALAGGKLSSQANTQRSRAGYREQTDNSFYTSQLKDLAGTIDGNQEPYGSDPRTGLGKRGEDSSRFDKPSHSVDMDVEAGPNTLSSARPILDEISSDEDSSEEVGSVVAGPSSSIYPDKGETTGQKVNNQGAEGRISLTSEEHNALLLQDPRMRKSSTANPDFIRQFYSESRLHHLSTWKAELKSEMQRLAAEKGQQSKATKRKPGSRRYILHVDFDSFFCAVSLKNAPEHVDKPAVVAHGTGNGSEIASCNYPARAYGVKNGMWMKRARELCPHLQVLPYDFPAYEEASRLFYQAILEVGGVVQSVSIDEALLDVTSLVLEAVGSGGSGVDEGSIWREQDKANQLASRLRDTIKSRTGCAVSVGIGGNILLAKVALRKAKPAGQFQIRAEDAQRILGELEVDQLPGVAYSIGGKLEEMGVKYVKDVRQVSKERLAGALGPKTGERVWEYARGIDGSEVGDQPIRKSVSAEVNWGIRFVNQAEADDFVVNLCQELERRLLKEQVKGRQLTMKIMRRCLDAPLDPAKHLGHGKCDTFSKSTTFGVPTHQAEVLGKEAVAILRSYKFSPGDLRGLGIQLTKLEPIKSLTSGPDGSQKKISFGAATPHVSGKRARHDPIRDVFDDVAISSRTPPGGGEYKADPIVDGPLTPRKAKPTCHPALYISRMNEKDAKATTPLNIRGTQFLLPPNPDPAVIAQLPPDIRSRLLAQTPARRSRATTPSTRSGSPVPAPAPAPIQVPHGYDPDVFNALPEDLKAELLAARKPRAPQKVMPASPRKDSTMQPPARRHVPNPIFSRTRDRRPDAPARAVQTSLSLQPQERAGGGAVDEPAHLDPAFLAELPPEMRDEIVADHRRRRAQRSGLDIVRLQQQIRRTGAAAAAPDDTVPAGQARLQFAPPPPKARFSAAGLTAAVAPVRDLLGVWHQRTAADGPDREDVARLEDYLVQVVSRERDMDKACKLVRWLQHLVEEEGEGKGEGEDGADSAGKPAWRAVVARVKQRLQSAVQKRGLGPLDI